MQLVDSREAALRTRAAIAYSGKEQSEIAELSGIPLYTIRRIVSLANPRGAPIEELWLIADACTIPRWFMEAGFDVDLAQDADIDLAITDEMRQYMALKTMDLAVDKQIAALEADVKEIADTLSTLVSQGAGASGATVLGLPSSDTGEGVPGRSPEQQEGERQ